MKKKDLKKLTLHRETLAELDGLNLANVGGGATTICEWSGRNTCTTCQLTCTTNYC